ncbi:MAG: hypothetical protein WKG01_36790 [Kofleriaceae bacterium]
MRWIVLVLFVVACGGPEVPAHSGYKSDKSKPWTKAKPLKIDEKGELKSDGELSYGELKRARWYAIELPSHGELSLRLEITPPGDATNEDFDLGFEVLSPAYRAIHKSDLEDEDAHEVTKTTKLVELPPGKYLVHLFLQGRMDSAEYTLRGTFKSTSPAELKSDFPAQVAFLDPLPMVPLADDAPRGWKPDKKPVIVKSTGRKPVKVVEKKPTPVTAVSARIMNISVVGGGTQILIGRGTASGASDGMRAKINGIGDMPKISNCKETSCQAVFKATPDQVKGGGGSVTLLP